MLKINDNEYSNNLISISSMPFSGVVDGTKKEGKGLVITCKAPDFKLEIETVYDINLLKELKVSDTTNISKYVIGLPYQDKKGWMYMTNKCNCSLKRISENEFNISLEGNFEECDETFNIDLDYNFHI